MIEKELISFAGKGLNSDDDIDLIPLGDSLYRLDIVYPNGDMNVIDNRSELTQISISGITGSSKKVLGWCNDIENDALIFFLYTSINNYIFRIYSDNTSQKISQGDWGFNPSYKIYDSFIIGTGDDSLLCFNDGLNPQRCVNIKNLIDGDYTLLYNEIDLLKPACIKNLGVEYNTTITPTSTGENKISKIRGKRFQFAISYVYDNKLECAVSHWSRSIHDYRDEFMNGLIDVRNKVEFTKIIVNIPVYFDNISSVKIFVKEIDIESGKSGSWGMYHEWDYDEAYVVDGHYNYDFYNDKQTIPVDQSLFLSLYDDIPFTSQIMKPINGDRIILGHNNFKYSNIDIDIDLAVQNVVSTAPAYYNDINIDYDKIPMSLNVRGSVGKWLQFSIVIIKESGGEVKDIERYFYQYYNSAEYGGYMANVDVVNFFVDDINANTKFPLTASIAFGGFPYSITFTKTLGTDTFHFYSISYPIFEKKNLCKNNSVQNLAICYYDKYGRGGRALIDNLSVTIPSTSGSNITGHYTNYIKYTINHLPPSWAVCYQFLYGGSNISNYFSISVRMGVLGTGYPLPEELDIKYEGIYTKIDLTQAINRCYDANESVNFNNFDIQKGDRVRIVGYTNYLDTTSTGIIGVEFINLGEYIDVEVLGIDLDGKILIPSLKRYNESRFFNIREIYVLEFYRTHNLNKEEIFYKEIGDLIPITGGYHESTWINGVSGSKQDQSAYGAAIGLINFGDTYRFYSSFCDILRRSAPTTFYALPFISNIESMSSSLSYNSNALSTGRHNWYDKKWENKTEEALIFGNLYRSGDLNFNEINRFVNDPVYLDSKYGEITGIEQKGDTLTVFQKNKINTFYLNKVQVTLADGSTQMAYSDKVLSEKNLMPYEIGCSHQGSIQKNIYNIYFFDLNTSAIYRLGQDGINNISVISKMKNYWIALSKVIQDAIKNGNDIKIESGYDPVKGMYVFTYVNNTITSQNITIGYHEPSNKWLSNYSFYHELYANLNENRFLSFSNGLMYEHHISSTKVATGYLTVHFNKFPADVKLFRSIELNSKYIWLPSESGDISIEGYLRTDTNSREKFYTKMSSLLKSIHFRNYEGRFLANFRRNMLNKKEVLGGKAALENGDLLRGKSVSIKLRNTQTTENKLKSVTIGFEKSK